MSINANVPDRQRLLDAIQDVRDDRSSTNWVLVCHEGGDPNTIGVQATGSDGLKGLQALLAADQVQYALLRVVTRVDLSNTVKFVYIYNLGENVGFAKKGRFGIVKGDVTKYFQPFHVDMEISGPAEISDEVVIVTKLVENAAGNADHVRDAAFVQGKQERGYTPFMQKGSPTKTSNPSLSEASGGAASVATGSSSSSSGGGSGGDAPTSGTRSHHGSRGNLADAGTGKATGVPGKPTVGVVATQSQGVKFGEDLGEALREMRKDASTTRWVLGTYQGGSISNPIVLAGKGEGGIDDVKKLLTPDVICYGIKRVTDMIDGHPTTKFAHFVWIGNAVSIMSKAKISTHKGAIGEFFAPFHVDLTVSEHRELSDSIIHDKVAAYSGSKSHVK